MNLWIYYRTVQWLEGKTVPGCYEVKLLEPQSRQELKHESEWYPAFLGVQTMGQDEDAPAFYYDPRRLNLFSRDMHPIIMFSIDPLHNTKHLRKISFTDYIGIVSDHADFRDYISAIKAAERSGIISIHADPR